MQLAAVSKRGYDIWSLSLVEKGSEQLALALRALKVSGNNLKRAWDEVAVEVETETGESKEEKMLVPSAVLPHTLCLLLDTASAVHDVRSPPLALHGATVQGLVDRLAEAVVAVHEKLSDEDLGLWNTIFLGDVVSRVYTHAHTTARPQTRATKCKHHMLGITPYLNHYRHHQARRRRCTSRSFLT